MLTIQWNAYGESILHPHERDTILRDGPGRVAAGVVALDTKASADGNGNLWLLATGEPTPKLLGSITGLQRRANDRVFRARAKPVEPVEVMLEEITEEDAR